MSSNKVTLSTLGMFIIDSFEFPNSNINVEDQIGGGGTYVMIGARVWLRPEQLGMIVDRGHDFPSHSQTTLDHFGPIWIYRDSPIRETTRATETYEGQYRHFKYTNPQFKVKLTHASYSGTRAEHPEFLHAVCSPDRMADVLQELKQAGTARPRIIYEPLPSSCIPSELEKLRRLLPEIDIISPNHEELGGIYGISSTEGGVLGAPADRKAVEELASRLIKDGAKDIVAVRSGERGAYVVDKEGNGGWTPAYHTSAAAVVDPTGAGNGFLGGFVGGMKKAEEAGLSKAAIMRQAAICGSISASYMIEQYGLPVLKHTAEGELWNDTRPESRQREMQAR